MTKAIDYEKERMTLPGTTCTMVRFRFHCIINISIRERHTQVNSEQLVVASFYLHVPTLFHRMLVHSRKKTKLGFIACHTINRQEEKKKKEKQTDQ